MLVSELITALQLEDRTLLVCSLEENGSLYFAELENIEVVDGVLYLGSSRRINQILTYLNAQKTQAQQQIDYHTQAIIDQEAILDELNNLGE